MHNFMHFKLQKGFCDFKQTNNFLRSDTFNERILHDSQQLQKFTYVYVKLKLKMNLNWRRKQINVIKCRFQDLSYKDKHWHEACFLCNRCRVSLVDKQFGSKVDKIYCGNCYDAQFASRCDGCGEIFRAGM